MNPFASISLSPTLVDFKHITPAWRWLAGGGVLALAIGLWLWSGKPGGQWLGLASAKTADEQAPREESPQTVTLSARKIEEANIETATVVTASVQAAATVSGRVGYDAARRWEITTPLDCVVQEVLIQPGQNVAKGDSLLVLSSAEVGLARDHVSRAKDDLTVSRRELEYANEIYANVKALIALFQQSPTPAEAAKQLTGQRMGEHREHLLASYSKMVFAKKSLDETDSLGSSGAISGRLLQQRRSDAEVSGAAFESQRETSVFESLQARDKAAAAVAQQERQLQIAQQRVRSLVGSLPLAETSDEHDLSRLVAIAPQAGRVDELAAVKYQRLMAGSRLAVVADTSRLWLSANIHEREWRAATLKPGAELKVHFPAFEGQQFTANVRFVGAEVSPETRSLPLVAEIDNPKGVLKPGMFAWIAVPVESPRTAVVVPPAAIMRHEEYPFVFVAQGQGAFRRIDVKVGVESPQHTEITAGLRGGEQVVVHGAFILKSELLLEHEE